MDVRTDAKVLALRGAFQTLIRRFGLLDTGHTPCGQPISITHAQALIELLRSTEQKQGELARTLGLSKSAGSRMATELERRGWIARPPDPADGRVRRLRLTAKGKRRAQQVDEASIARFSAMMEAIPSAQRDRTIAALERLHRAIPTEGEG